MKKEIGNNIQNRKEPKKKIYEIKKSINENETTKIISFIENDKANEEDKSQKKSIN